MKFQELVSIGELQALCETFTRFSNAVTAILDLEGNILVSTGWRHICTRFHRVHPVTAFRCRESDTVLAGRLEKGERYNIYRCKNGLVDAAVPIHIAGEHVANLFTGQFFMEPPDREYFARQADEFGFDRKAYMEALDEVPIYTEYQIRSMMEFLTGLARIIGETGLAKKRLEEAVAELRAHKDYLEKRVTERTVYLSEANRALQQEVVERKRANEKLRLTQFAVDNFTDSSIWLDPDGRIIYVNEITCQKLGYTRDELLSMRVWEIDPNFSYERYLEKWKELKKRYSIKFESTHVRKDGSSYPVEVSANYLKFENREYEVSFDRDIAERKQKEMELSDTKALVELYLDLMSHDINNINQVALGYLDLAKGLIRSGDRLGEDKIELIEKPITSLNNSSKLIDKVMKLRKLKTMELRVGRIDIGSVLARIKDRYSHVAGRDVTINYIPSAECRVNANELIDEIFINLVENSIKHTPKDRPLVIDIIQAAVCEDGKEYARISIEDNGPGISDEMKEKLFARFSRGETKAKGTGLGLYLVKTLVEEFRGKIWVEDRIAGDHANGAKFVVMLPSVGQ